MKILSINSIQTFTNSKKSKAKFNNKTCSNITVSEANSNGRWFHSKCDNPFLQGIFGRKTRND